MSTILKALKRLEHDKQAQAARERGHDPLDPAWAAAEPVATPAPRRPLASWLAVAGLAAALGAAVSYGLASWWIARETPATPVGVAADAPPAPSPLAAVPAVAAPAVPMEPVPARTSARAGEAASTATSSAGAVPTRAAASGAPSPSPSGPGAGPDQGVLLAQAAAGEPDPWEQAARSAPTSDAPRAGDARGTPPDAATSSRGASATASSTVPANASSARPAGASSASSGGTAAPGTARPPAVAARPPAEATASGGVVGSGGATAARSTGSSAPAAPPAPSQHADASGSSLEGAVPVSSLPELALPEPTPEVAPPAPPPRRPSAAAARPPAEKRARTSPAPSPKGESSDKPEIQVVKTVWHPRPERRSARVRLPDRVDVLEVHQDDVVGGWVVSEITPSAVVLARGDAEFTYRVGR